MQSVASFEAMPTSWAQGCRAPSQCRWWIGDADGPSSALSSDRDEQRFPFMDSDDHERMLSTCSPMVLALVRSAGRALQHGGKQLGGNAVFYSAQSLQNYSLSVL